MKKNIFAIFFIFALTAAGMAYAGTAVFRNNVLTSSHVSPPGTHVAIAPPGGSVLSATFVGFELQNNGRIQITERAGVSYEDTAGTLTKEGVEALNITFKDKSPVTLNGTAATLISGVSISNPSEAVLLLVLGDSRMTVYIFGFYKVADNNMERVVRNALLSCIFSPVGVKSVSGDYLLSTAGTSLQFSDEVGATRFFTVGGAGRGDIDVALYTSMVTDDYVPREARQAYAGAAINRFTSSLEGALVLSTRQINFGGLPGIETIAEFSSGTKRTRTASGANVKRGIKGLAYQALLFDDNDGKIYVFSGTAVRDADSYVSQFAKITSTFSLKR
ncbi:MAG: hypothetical protein FWE55_01140 [Synergistaceae bacterium]|nr:hypothetical protein [Synergistaceae bacterium]